ncbi:hypothetical protein JCM10908_000129 [Rhodotorula pacifica]|uniref:uncharacterized protein n=1 Tax=Rhodotorula pacifica TaxID=1495444 RepID=UPI0031822A95
MPPRRSARSTAKANSNPTLDVTGLSDSSSSPGPALPAAGPSSCSPRGGPSRARATTMMMDADEALARALQAEEDAAAAREQEGEAPAASTSTRTNGLAPLQQEQDLLNKPLTTGDPDDPKVVLSKERSLFIQGAGCQKCRENGTGTTAEEKEKDMGNALLLLHRETIPLTAESKLQAFLDLTIARCEACGGVEICRGCGIAFEREGQGEDGQGSGEEEGRKKGECCAEGRAIAIFELLSSLDAIYTLDHLQRPSATASTTAAKKRKRTAAGANSAAALTSGKGAGTGYDSGSSYSVPGLGGAATSNGTGYAADDYDSYDDSEMDEFGFGGGEGGRDFDPGMYEDEESFYEAMEAKLVQSSKKKGKAAVAGKKGAAEKGKGKNGKGGGSGDQGRGKKAPQTITVEAARDAAQDRIYLCALQILSSLLPQPDSPSPRMYDFLPHPSLSSLIELSTLPDLLATLLRNDSVPEWQRRSDLYFGMLEVLGLLGGCEATLQCLFKGRREKRYVEGGGIGGWMERRGEIVWEYEQGAEPDSIDTAAKGKGKGKATTAKGKKRQADSAVDAEPSGKVVLATPLYSLLKKLLIQAHAFRRAASSSTEFDDADFALLGICGDFATAGERFVETEKVWEERMRSERRRLEKEVQAEEEEGASEERRSSARRAGKGKGAEKEQRLWTEMEYVKACEELAYGAVELDVKKHHYTREITESASSRRPHGSFVHLAKELAVLSTSLPAGIWVRHDEERVDVIKCMIAGPEHSPYAGGLFEFDIFLPLRYPEVSPLCWLVTTGGNKVRFNPNLYAEGKVCLSLLGTWSGTPEEMWQPNKSTILQVLLSITSMILGTNYPFYNEPGFGAPRDDDRNKTYNKNISLATARWAILDWLENDKYKQSIWADVIASHFLLRRSQILATVKDWAKKDPRLHAWTPQHDKVAGTHMLEPYGYGGLPYVSPWKPDGSQKSQAEMDAERAKLREAEKKRKKRDLVGEMEQALQRLEGGAKGSEVETMEWLEKLVA